MTTKTLLLSDHTRIELLVSAAGQFRGLGDITVRGVPLRNGAVPAPRFAWIAEQLRQLMEGK